MLGWREERRRAGKREYKAVGTGRRENNGGMKLTLCFGRIPEVLAVEGKGNTESWP
jgi:hypothetical protein